jgi:hypothetical protein
MRFDDRGGTCANESAIFPQLLNVLCSGVSHTCSQSADKLIDKVAKRPPVWHAAFYAFGDKFTFLGGSFLSISFC